jgi:hypothetical protein
MNLFETFLAYLHCTTFMKIRTDHYMKFWVLASAILVTAVFCGVNILLLSIRFTPTNYCICYCTVKMGTINCFESFGVVYLRRS